MLFDPLAALATIIVGFHGASTDAKQRAQWFNFGASLFGTAFCTFFFAWGSSIWALYSTWGAWGALLLGFGSASVTMAIVVYLFWLRSPMTRGLGLMVPSPLAEKALDQNTTYTEKP